LAVPDQVSIPSTIAIVVQVSGYPLPGASFFILGTNQAGSIVAPNTTDAISLFVIASGWNSTQATPISIIVHAAKRTNLPYSNKT